jgi:integrase
MRIDTKRGRDALSPRREPYWYKLGRDRHLGLRRLSESSYGTWIARFRDEDGARHYKSLDECSDAFDFDVAKTAAEVWFRDLERGVSGQNDDGTTASIATACAAYVRVLCAGKRIGAARDAHMRFRRTVYGDTFDVTLLPLTRDSNLTDLQLKRAQKKKGAPDAHSIANTALAKIRGARLQEWHVGLTTAGLSNASANRTLTSLKAALNLAVRSRMVNPSVALEWSEVAPLKGASRQRTLFLDLTQRKALLAQAHGAIHDLLEATMQTGCRAGELVRARRSAFDARTRSLAVTGKTGPRTLPLAPQAQAVFTRFARDKLPSAYLFVRDDGKPWAHSDWDELVKEAAKRADLPAETCLYTLRHSFITQALLDGVSTLEVSKFVGTSLAMIEKHYGHLVANTVRDRMAKIQFV